MYFFFSGRGFTVYSNFISRIAKNPETNQGDNEKSSVQIIVYHFKETLLSLILNSNVSDSIEYLSVLNSGNLDTFYSFHVIHFI